MSEETLLEQKTKRAKVFELLIVIVLGVTAIATAWASWQASLHSGKQDVSFIMATRLTAEANSMYNEAVNYMNQDMNIWNQIVSLRIDLAFASNSSNADEVEKIEYKLNQIMADNVGDEFARAIDWADAQTEYASPFDRQEFIDSYFIDAQAVFAEADRAMEAGNVSSGHADQQGLVTVLFAVVLFLLGIAATLKAETGKMILFVVSLVGFAAATVIMLSIPIVLP